MDGPISRLGTTQGVVSAPVKQKVGWRRTKFVPREFGYLEWTIDAVPLREWFRWSDGDLPGEVTPIQNDYASREYAVDYLRLLLGDSVDNEYAVMPDGRVPLLLCHIDFDLGCQTLTAGVVRAEHTVEWRDIAWQVSYERLVLSDQGAPVISLAFDKAEYDGVIRTLLEGALSRLEESQ